MRFAPALFISACCVSSPGPSELFILDRARAGERAAGLFERPTVVIELPPRDVAATRDLYDFMFQELPFMAACVRELGRGRYLITRDGDGFIIDDQDGLRLGMRLLYQDDARWVFIGSVQYGSVEGEALTILTATPGMHSEGRIYCRLDGFFVRLFVGFFVSTMRAKAAAFVEAAQHVAEEASRDPAGFAARMASTLEPAALATFRRKFVR